jgi:hypothetical protein
MDDMGTYMMLGAGRQMDDMGTYMMLGAGRQMDECVVLENQ